MSDLASNKHSQKIVASIVLFDRPRPPAQLAERGWLDANPPITAAATA